MTLDEREKEHLEGVQVGPEPPCFGGQGRDDLPDAEVAEEPGQRDGNFVQVPSPQLDQVRGLVLCNGAIDGRVDVGSEGKKSDLNGKQAVVGIQATRDFSLVDVGLGEHGSVLSCHPRRIHITRGRLRRLSA
jgi:hypothetical protein